MFRILLVAFLAISVVTFFLYVADKSRAKKGKWRIPERTLLLFSFFGGAAGGLGGMYLVRHKTRHWYFVFINVVGLIWQLGLLAWLLIK